MKNLFIVDLNQDKITKNPYISQTLIDKIEFSLEENKKTILYINKRWNYSLVICQDCNYIYKCPKCDISLTLHKTEWKMICHHCWYEENYKISCPKCHSTNTKNIWVWTKQVEEFITSVFPNAKIFRLDTDNIKSQADKKNALEEIKTSQIIIWTKMITTWFDFSDIWIIWVILLEQELQIPKYDTEEKIFSNIKQLIGRWWRSWTDTDIVIQTYTPNNEMIKNILFSNYKDFFKKTCDERKLFSYPPFCEIVTIRYKNTSLSKSQEFITKLKNKLDIINNWKYEIIQVKQTTKRNNQYFSKIIIKWVNIRDFLENIKKDILLNKDLALIFE